MLEVPFLNFFIAGIDVDSNYICNPIVAPDSAFYVNGKLSFPKTKFIITCLDTLRDGVLKLFIKFAKLGIDIEGVIYRHQLHTIMSGGFSQLYTD